MRKIIGVVRASKYSPNSNDYSIMERVARELEGHGYTVRLVDEEAFAHCPSEAAAYYSMARGEAALMQLEKRRKARSVVVNPPEGVRNCVRSVITGTMQAMHIPIPCSEVLFQLNGIPANKVGFPCWIKRGDACAQKKEDVAFVSDETEWNVTFAGFLNRGIQSAVVSEHLVGNLVKFYGVEGTGFFRCYYPTFEGSAGKFGFERINECAYRYAFDKERLQAAADGLARLSSVPIYGGDCIVDGEGNYRIIDFNDWPSFSRCLEEAGAAIAEYLEKRICQEMSIK